MAPNARTSEKFSCATSRFLLPTFRRPSYREIMNKSVESDSDSATFTTWTKEEGQYYHKINKALLQDDYDFLSQNVRFINNLRTAIRNNHQKEAVKVYRGLCISSDHAREEYKVGLQFLWPTFSCTSKNRDVAHGFGDYVFEIDATSDDWTYRTDISKYSEYPQEEEVLFYPYSGFRVTNVMHDAKVIQLKCMDTIAVENEAEKHISDTVKISDPSRNIFVYFYKKTADVHWCYADKPHEMFLIAANRSGYWDAPYRYHHRNGYFVDKGQGVWEEYHHDKFFARFTRVSAHGN